MQPKKTHLTYKDSGVDIERGNLFVKEIKPMVASTRKKGVIANIGSFSGLFAPDLKKYKDPVLVSSTDGVGTKLLIAQKTGMHKRIGFDLVGMCANDIATTGAEPLFFLDYVSTGRLKPKILKEVISGISQACKQAGYALVGGETAEMPDMYKPGEYDLAGFCVGIIEKKKIIDGSNIKKGDIVIGLASNGLHSNGYSLVRKVFSEREIASLKKELLKPTRLYTKALLSLKKRVRVKGIAHITGGAYIDKIPRIIPKGLSCQIVRKSWPVPRIFGLIQNKGNIRDKEMYRVFNMGIGMVVVIQAKDIKKTQALLKKHNIKSWAIGEIIKDKEPIRLV
ncbi:MAG: phosphoribosylformylglycinamidine cyclo-ligase [Candidatus Omnitrophica bacterium]|nr:phosphoribosylformylglycinamidine cyclo-ligase [Candidatus Omnitrophota bacterium]